VSGARWLHLRASNRIFSFFRCVIQYGIIGLSAAIGMPL
jgi:hypothetical protein